MWGSERSFGNARFPRRYGTQWYVFQMMWSFQDGPASALPLTQTLSNIYGRRSASPDVPGSDLDETQVRKRANFAKINCGSKTCLLPRYCYRKLKPVPLNPSRNFVMIIITWLMNMFIINLSSWNEIELSENFKQDSFFLFWSIFLRLINLINNS